MENEKKYYLGLDIGTNSVGWCVTDENYNIIKKHRVIHDIVDGKKVIRKAGAHLWGARLFEEASDASSRRMARSSRRRLARRRRRILLLQSLFNDEMNKLDPDFFDRLNNSSLHNEDKPLSIQDDFLLFSKKVGNLSDSKFFEEYPTIYHLRKKMIENPDVKFDLREVYLVMAHMIKYRGNFLKDGKMNSVGTDSSYILEKFNDIDNCLASMNEVEDEEVKDDTYKLFEVNSKQASELLNAFKDIDKRGILLDKELDILGFKKSNSDIRTQILYAINGATPKLSNFYPELKDENDEIANKKVEFGNDDFNNSVLPNLPGEIGDDRAAIFVLLKELYDFRSLVNVLKGEQYISNSMVRIYNLHQKHLRILKDLYRKYAKDKYSSFFRTIFNDKNEPVVSYASYIGYTKIKGQKISINHATSIENLYKKIKSDLPIDKIDDVSFNWVNSTDRDDLVTIKDAYESNNLLPRQNSRNNGVFPYQLNEIEMERIIDNQKKYYSFLGDKAPDFNNPNIQSYKLISLLKYKVPYYVGPLSSDKKEDGTKMDNHWMVRKKGQENIKITPWNFNEVVDKHLTEEEFINRMKNKCTYLIGEETLPATSLTYQKFVLFNEINNWTINGHPFTKEEKQYLIENVYLKHKKVSLTSLGKALKSLYKEDVKLSTKKDKALDGEDIHASLSSFIDLAKVFGKDFYKDKKLYDLAEQVIFTFTILEDKNIAAEKLQELGLKEEQIKILKTFNFSKWGKLSRKLLEGIKTEVVNVNTGEVSNYSIMDLLEETNLNFMEIYETNDKFDFKKQVEKLNASEEITPQEFIEEEYASPAMKRSLWQTFKIIDELKKILKIEKFDGYYIECTREEKEKERTKSRKTQLEEYYKVAKGVSKELSDELESISDERLRSKKVFLYFLQMGKSVYTGEPIDLNQLDKKYDIDHIIPQAKVKDDSLTNIVLVEREINNKKQDTYPIPSTILNETGRNHVRYLNSIKVGKLKLLSDDKAKRILRSINKPLTEEEEAGFVNRQLTMTNQSVKATCDIIKYLDKDARIVYSKAGLVSDFRKEFDFPKCRSTNDFHHANDAYLNIVVGDVYNRVFTSYFSIEKLRKRKEKDHDNTVKFATSTFFRGDRHDFLTDRLVWKAKPWHRDENGQIIDEDKEGTLDLVRKYMSYQDPMVTQMLFTQTGKQGFFNKISIHSKYSADAVMPLKDYAPFNSEGYESKYGGYNDLTAPYFILVKSKDKKGDLYSLENIPSVYARKVSEDNSFAIKYLTEKCGLNEPVILLPKLLLRTILRFPGGAEMTIRGKSGDKILGKNNLEIKSNFFINDYVKSIDKLLGNNQNSNERKPDLTRFENIGDEFTYSSKYYSKELNLKLFDWYLNILKQDIFYSLSGLQSFVDNVISKRDDFMNLSIINQIKLLSNLISITSCTRANGVDMSLINLSSYSAIIKCTKRLQSGIKIVVKSITGFYEDVLFEVPNK